MMLNIAEPGTLPISERQIVDVEKSFGLSFPVEYKQFMLDKNGGIVASPRSFKIADGKEEHIEWFYNIAEDTRSDIRRANDMKAGRLPKGFVSIGYDGGGNEICIDCNQGENYGCVYFWDHDFEADQASGMTPEEAGNYYLIAKSFSEFCGALF